MKKLVLLSATAIMAATTINAQTLDPANRNKAAIKLTRVTKQSTISNVTTPQGEMSNRGDNTTKSVIDVSAITAQGGTAEIKITAMKIESSAMGQDMSYDSEHPDDGDSQVGDEVKDVMKTPTKITLDANGLITAVKASSKVEASMEQNPTGNPYEKGNTLSIYLKLPKLAKLNDTWTEEKKDKDMNSKTTYTFKSFENGLATVEAITALKIDGQMEKMGMTMYQKLEGNVASTLLVDPKNLVVKKSTSTTVLKGDIEAGGQKMPISILVNSTDTVE